MKRIVLLLLGLLLALPQFAQERKYSTFYEQRATLFEELPVTSKDIIFLGNSITNGCEWAELFQNKNVKNRGISGDICMGVYDRLDPIVKGKPAKIFLLIGINDVSRGTSADKIISEISMIVRKIKQESPKTKLYLQSVLPVNDCYGMFNGHTSRWQMVKQINDLLEPLAVKEGAEPHRQGRRAGLGRGGKGLARKAVERRGARARHPRGRRRDQRVRYSAGLHVQRHRHRLQRPPERAGTGRREA